MWRQSLITPPTHAEHFVKKGLSPVASYNGRGARPLRGSGGRDGVQVSAMRGKNDAREGIKAETLKLLAGTLQRVARGELVSFS